MQSVSTLNTRVGESVWLVKSYNNLPAGTELLFSGATDVGDVVYISAKSFDGKGGAFAPVDTFSFNPPASKTKWVGFGAEAATLRTSAPVADEASAGEETVVKDPEEMFTYDGADEDTPLIMIFRAFSPVSDAARELFGRYRDMFGEFDTDPLEDLIMTSGCLADIWTDVQIQDMLDNLKRVSGSAPFVPEPHIVSAPSIESFEKSDNAVLKSLYNRSQAVPAVSSAPVFSSLPGTEEASADTECVPIVSFPRRRGRPRTKKEESVLVPIGGVRPASLKTVNHARHFVREVLPYVDWEAWDSVDEVFDLAKHMVKSVLLVGRE